MKKMFAFVVVLLMVFVITGCGNNEIKDLKVKEFDANKAANAFHTCFVRKSTTYPNNKVDYTFYSFEDIDGYQVSPSIIVNMKVVWGASNTFISIINNAHETSDLSVSQAKQSFNVLTAAYTQIIPKCEEMAKNKKDKEYIIKVLKQDEQKLISNDLTEIADVFFAR